MPKRRSIWQRSNFEKDAKISKRRSEERRVGKGVDLGGRRIIKRTNIPK